METDDGGTRRRAGLQPESARLRPTARSRSCAGRATAPSPRRQRTRSRAWTAMTLPRKRRRGRSATSANTSTCASDPSTSGSARHAEPGKVRAPGPVAMHRVRSSFYTCTRDGRRLTMGVHGFDFEDRSGRSEPTSPERRERAGKLDTRQRQLGSRGLNHRDGCPDPAARSGCAHHEEQLTRRFGLGAGEDISQRLGNPQPAAGRRGPEIKPAAALGEVPRRARKTRVRLPPPPRMLSVSR